MGNLLLPLIFLAALAVGVLVWQRIRVQQRSRERLTEGTVAPAATAPEVAPPLIRPRHWLPWAVGLMVGIVLGSRLAWPPVFAVAFGLIVALLGGQLEQMRVSALTFRLEQQLSDAVDLMVAALQAGSGTLRAMESALQEARRPLRGELEVVLGRIRYGDDPQAVLKALEQRIPLEVCRLFVSALSVHWETGGSLAPTLATVGRVVRDRIEVNRRIRTLTTQGRASAAAILVLTYVLALVMWRNDPDRMARFLGTNLGQFLVAGALLLQALGIVWTAQLSRMKY